MQGYAEFCRVLLDFEGLATDYAQKFLKFFENLNWLKKLPYSTPNFQFQFIFCLFQPAKNIKVMIDAILKNKLA